MNQSLRRLVVLIPAAVAVAATGIVPPALAGSPVAPVELRGLPTFLPGGSYNAFEKPFIEVRVTNRSTSTIMRDDGQIRLYLTRKADSTPTGRSAGTGEFSGTVTPGKTVIGMARIIFPKGSAGHYRLTVCADTPGHRMRCAVAKGTLTVIPLR